MGSPGFVGAALIAGGGIGVAIAANAAAFAAAALIAQRVPYAARAEAVPESSLLADIGTGLDHAWRSRDTRAALLIILAAALSSSGLFAVGRPAPTASWRASPWAFGLSVSAWGSGQLSGTAAAATRGPAHHRHDAG